jgi:hypothetical protein
MSPLHLFMVKKTALEKIILNDNGLGGSAAAAEPSSGCEGPLVHNREGISCTGTLMYRNAPPHSMGPGRGKASDHYYKWISTKKSE